MKKRKVMSYPAVIALGFAILVAVGTVLLMLPAASRSGQSAGFVDALFTAASASCVTGLIVFDTATQWTLFGQGVILVLIQIGGLGFMTILMMFSMFLRRRIGLAERSLMKESVNTLYVGGIVGLTKRILLGTLLFEGVGAVILSLRFIPDFGLWAGIWRGVWHSVSAFCNAGFDLMGSYSGPFSSLTAYVGDPAVVLTVCALVLIGGLGFFVWDDIAVHKRRFKRYALHTKIVLVSSAVLVAVPTLVFFISEKDAAFAGLSGGERLLAALFAAVTPRTAGFNTVDVTSMSPVGSLLTILLMFVGGCPGSTAGGVKTTTVAVIVWTVVCSMRGQNETNMFGRRLEAGVFRRASAVAVVNLTLALGACFIIGMLQPALSLQSLLFETFSAVGTVGMTMGITTSLLPVCRVLVALLMFCGRVGSLSFALIFTEDKSRPTVLLPAEQVNIG